MALQGRELPWENSCRALLVALEAQGQRDEDPRSSFGHHLGGDDFTLKRTHQIADDTNPETARQILRVGAAAFHQSRGDRFGQSWAVIVDLKHEPGCCCRVFLHPRAKAYFATGWRC